MGTVSFNPKKVKNIYLICSGNLGRSPAFAELCRSSGLEERLKGGKIYSAGTDVENISNFNYSTASPEELSWGFPEALNLDLLKGNEKKSAQRILNYLSNIKEGEQIPSDKRAEIEKMSRQIYDKLYKHEETQRDTALKTRGYKPIGKHTPKQLKNVRGSSNLIVAVSDSVRKRIEDMYKDVRNTGRPQIISVTDLTQESVEDAFCKGPEAYHKAVGQLKKATEELHKYF